MVLSGGWRVAGGLGCRSCGGATFGRGVRGSLDLSLLSACMCLHAAAEALQIHHRTQTTGRNSKQPGRVRWRLAQWQRVVSMLDVHSRHACTVVPETLTGLLRHSREWQCGEEPAGVASAASAARAAGGGGGWPTNWPPAPAWRVSGGLVACSRSLPPRSSRAPPRRRPHYHQSAAMAEAQRGTQAVKVIWRHPAAHAAAWALAQGILQEQLVAAAHVPGALPAAAGAGSNTAERRQGRLGGWRRQVWRRRRRKAGASNGRRRQQRDSGGRQPHSHAARQPRALCGPAAAHCARGRCCGCRPRHRRPTRLFVTPPAALCRPPASPSCRRSAWRRCSRAA